MNSFDNKTKHLNIHQNGLLFKNDIENDTGTRELANHVDERIKSYEWFPKETKIEVFEKYINLLPVDKRPIKNTAGGEYRQRQMERQLPMHDFEINVCDSIMNDYDKEKFNEFINDYEKPAIGLGEIVETTDKIMNCSSCNQLINDDVHIEIKHSKMINCHACCFKCQICNELLVDLIYFYSDNSIYCGRHFSELIRPRCAACDELIFSKEYTKAENQFWHLTHFCCWKCDKPLGGTKYSVVQSKPYCLECHDIHFAKKCDSCHQTINVNTPRLNFNNVHWHSNSECFSCFTCRKPLLNEKFIFKNGYIFCGIECKRRIIPKNSNSIGDVVQL